MHHASPAFPHFLAGRALVVPDRRADFSFPWHFGYGLHQALLPPDRDDKARQVLGQQLVHACPYLGDGAQGLQKGFTLEQATLPLAFRDTPTAVFLETLTTREGQPGNLIFSGSPRDAWSIGGSTPWREGRRHRRPRTASASRPAWCGPAAWPRWGPTSWTAPSGTPGTRPSWWWPTRAATASAACWAIMCSPGSGRRARPATGMPWTAPRPGSTGRPSWPPTLGPGAADGNREAAQFQSLRGVAWADGILYAADGPTVRQIDLRIGDVTTLIGKLGGPGGFREISAAPAEAVLDDPTARAAGTDCLREPWGLQVHDGRLYLADRGNHAVGEFHLANRSLRTLMGGPDLVDRGGVRWGLLRDGIPHPDRRHARLEAPCSVTVLAQPGAPRAADRMLVSTGDVLGVAHFGSDGVTGELPAILSTALSDPPLEGGEPVPGRNRGGAPRSQGLPRLRPGAGGPLPGRGSRPGDAGRGGEAGLAARGRKLQGGLRGPRPARGPDHLRHPGGALLPGRTAGRGGTLRVLQAARPGVRNLPAGE